MKASEQMKNVRKAMGDPFMQEAFGEDSPASSCSACWVVELNAECPSCEKYVDLLTAPDFWDGRALNVAEHGTKRSKCVEVDCPECGYTFAVDCEY